MTTKVFHNNQINAASNIITSFKNFDVVHLQAQMQSGKTGACLKTAFDLIESKSIESFHVLSAIGDLDLKNQWINKIITHFDDYFKPNSSNITQFNYYDLLHRCAVYLN